jgi:hypothetical protein
MDKPAEPATPFAEVYQAFLDDLAKEGRKPSTIHRYRYNIVRFETWLVETGRPATLASLEQSILFAAGTSRRCRSNRAGPRALSFPPLHDVVTAIRMTDGQSCYGGARVSGTDR